MANQRTRTAMAECLAIARARRARSEADHGRACNAELRSRSALDTANAQATVAQEDWQAHLTSIFDPRLGQMLGRLLNEAATEVQSAEQALAAAAAARADKARTWREHNVLCRRTDEIVTQLRRSATRAREEQALSSLADRITYDRCRL